MTMQTREEMGPGHEDSLKILVTTIYLANTADQDQFVYSNQFDVEELEIYIHIE